MSRFTSIAVIALALVACKKSDKAAPTPAAKTEPAPTAAAPAPAAAAPAAKESYKADELFDWATATAAGSHMDMLEAFNKPATVTGTITKVDDPATGEYGATLDAGKGHSVIVHFADFGKAAKDKKLKAGDTLTAEKCQTTQPTANDVTVVQCVLK
jgi:hypothetical protein